MTILLLVVCEYILLGELFSSRRPYIILVSLLGTLIAFLFFFLFFSKYHKTLKETEPG